MAPPTKPLHEKLWSKVDVRGPNECWPFRPAMKRGGYGSVSLGWRNNESSHRVAYELVKGPIPAGLLVRHTCDYPPCCNPAHLILGTHNDNMRDMKERGRGNGGTPPRVKCQRGHDDWYLPKDGRRRCRICRNMQAQKRRSKQDDIPEEPYQ